MKKLLFILLLAPALMFGQATGKVIADKPTGGSIGTAATTVDVVSLFNINQTTAGQTLTVPNLTNAASGKFIFIRNVGSVSFTLSPGGLLLTGKGAELSWTGAAWNVIGIGTTASVNPTSTFMPVNIGGTSVDSWIFQNGDTVKLTTGKIISSTNRRTLLVMDGGANDGLFYGDTAYVSVTGDAVYQEYNNGTVQGNIALSSEKSSLDYAITGKNGHIQIDSTENYISSTEKINFDAPLYSFNQATASKLAYWDDSKNLKPVTVGSGLSFSAGTLTATGTDTSSLSNRIDLKEDLANKSTDGTFAANSDTLYPTQKAVRTYITQNSAASLTFMLVDAASSWGGVYKQALSLPLYTVGAVATQTVTATTTGDLIGTFSTNSGYPNTTTIPIGLFSAHFDSQKTAGANNYYMYYEIYKKVLAGTETLLATSDNTSQTSVNTVVQQDATAALTTAVTLLATDRIVIKIYAKMASSTAVITLRYDDATSSRFQMPALIGSLDDYAKIASPTFTGTATIPTPFTLGATSVTSTGTQLNYLNTATGTTGTNTTNIVYSASPTLTGSPIAPTQTANDSSGKIATTEYIDSKIKEGSYTPTLFNTTNVAASTAYVTNWYRIGNTVTVWGQVDIDVTTTAINTVLGMSLPIASNLAAAADLAGSAITFSNVAGANVFGITADFTNDRVIFRGQPVSIANISYSFNFSYKIL